MAQFPKMPVWTDAYLADTTHLTTIQHGAFFLLLMAMWRAPEQRLPDNDETLCRYARLTLAQWRRVRPVLQDLCIVEGGWWRNKRLSKEFDAVKQYSQSQKKKADAKHLKNKDVGDAGAKIGQSPGYAPNPNPIPNSINPLTPFENSSIENGLELKNAGDCLPAIDLIDGINADRPALPVGTDVVLGRAASGTESGSAGGLGAGGAFEPLPLHFLDQAFPRASNEDEFYQGLPQGWKKLLDDFVEPEMHWVVAAGFWQKWVGPAPGMLRRREHMKQNWMMAFMHSCQVWQSKGRNLKLQNTVANVVRKFTPPMGLAAE